MADISVKEYVKEFEDLINEIPDELFVEVLDEVIERATTARDVFVAEREGEEDAAGESVGEDDDDEEESESDNG